MIVSAPPLAAGPGTTIALGGAGLIVVALAVVAVTVLIAVSRARFRRRAVRTSGTIVGHDARASENGVMYYSVVEFAAQDGAVIRGRTRTASNPAAGPVGGTAAVFYDPRDPYRISVDTGRTAVMSGCAIAVVTVITLMFAMFGLILLEIGLSS